MELTSLIDKLKSAFCIDGVDEMPQALYKAAMDHDVSAFDAYVDVVGGDLGLDYLQKVYQYYMADREDLGQDFTPESLAKLLGTITKDDDEVVDLCAGSGALTIQAWRVNPDRHFTCYEIDDTAVCFLLFNLCVRNIGGQVIHRDLFDGSKIRSYMLKASDKYSEVQIDGDNQ